MERKRQIISQGMRNFACMEENYYIVESTLSHTTRNSPKEILFGKWLSHLNYLKFVGISMQRNIAYNYIRDTLNNTLNPHILQGDNVLKMNQRTYEVVIKWFNEFIRDVNEWVTLVSETSNNEEGIIIKTPTCICITPFAKAIHTEDNEDTYGIELGDTIINFGSNYSPFPSVVMKGSVQNLDVYWDLMKNGETKYISHQCCKLLEFAINGRYNKLFDSIKYILQNKHLY